MLSPGSKGWIAKYFQLVETNEIVLSWNHPPEISLKQFNHHFFVQSGIVFGYPVSLLFAQEVDQRKWTRDEKLTVLLFEALLFPYLRLKGPEAFDREQFISNLNRFYKKHRVHSLGSLIGYFFKESKEEKIERILAKRTEVPRHITST